MTQSVRGHDDARRLPAAAVSPKSVKTVINARKLQRKNKSIFHCALIKTPRAGKRFGSGKVVAFFYCGFAKIAAAPCAQRYIQEAFDTAGVRPALMPLYRDHASNSTGGQPVSLSRKPGIPVVWTSAHFVKTLHQVAQNKDSSWAITRETTMPICWRCRKGI